MKTKYIATIVMSLLLALAAQAHSQDETVLIDATAHAQSFPHFWEEAFGSGRAILSLRESYRNDLREVKRATDFGYVRFHNILHDEVGIYDEDDQGHPIYNFSYVDQIYDGLLRNGVRPMVEISFMPKKMALRQDVHPFWYHPIVSPPKDYQKWDALMRALAQHLINRYGLDEVAQWYFEVWNEPNIDFWTGVPKESTYFDLYDHTARALKSVSPRLRVGGPATSSAHWVDSFLRHVAEQNVPIDFVSSHGYADDTVKDLFGADKDIPQDIPIDQRVCAAIRKVHDQIASSPRPKLPLFWTEWNVPSFGLLHARDTIYVGPALADDIRQCDGLVDMMSFWTFSDVFEEDGPKREPFDGGFGLMALGGIKKPSYAAFALLHQLGQERIPLGTREILVTRRADGTLAIAARNLVDPDQKGSARTIKLKIRGVQPNASVTVTRVDADHANTLAAYQKMGNPQYPTEAQVRELNAVAESNPPQNLQLHDGELDLQIPVDGLVLVNVSVEK
jgi:xylan 1,4-beta-xylosidase